MAIDAQNAQEIIINNTTGQAFNIYNGDWDALRKITKKWEFKDEASALRFALAILTLAKPDELSIKGDTMNPAESLLKGANADEE